MNTESSRSESGFTIVELVVVIALSAIVFSATLYMVNQGMSAQKSRGDRALQLELAQTAVQRLVRDLRMATSLTYNSSSSLSYTEPGAGTVTFSCSGTTCTRTTNGTGYTAITSLASTSVFTASPSTTSPTYIGISVSISTTSHTNVTLTDGANLRNVTLGT